jgi:tRNA 2-thiouridine synthesizing protein D
MSTSYAILVTGSPTNSQAHLSAIRFINALIETGHKVTSVFFYQDAVHVANRLTIKPNDEFQLTQEWAKLANSNNFELQVCVAASNRRAVLSVDEAQQNQIEGSSLHKAYSVLGLGQLAVVLAKSNDKNHRFIQFK